MNRLAISYAFNCSHVVDGVELVDTWVLGFLLAVAYRIPSQARYETEPTTLADFEGMTRMKERKLRYVRDLLVSLGEVREGGAGAPDHRDPSNRRPWSSNAVYQLPGLAGPLFLVTPWDVDMTAAQRAAWLARQEAARGGESAQRAGLVLSKPARGADFVLSKSARRAGSGRHTVPTFDEKAGGVLFPVLRSTNNHHDDGANALITDAASIAADDLFSKLVNEYQVHNGGAQLTVSKQVALPILARLLRLGYQPDKVAQMAVKLWTLTGDEPGCSWIATTNRSLVVLWEARDTLDLLVSRPQAAGSSVKPAAPCLYKHDPPCASVSACTALERRLVAEREAVG